MALSTAALFPLSRNARAFSSTARVFVDRNTKVICQGLTGHQ
ncbi:hypothetical protein ETH_00000520, partial [Eimeria tenella]